MNRLLVGLLFAALPISVMAQEVPTPDEVKKVLDFYYNGQASGLVLYDSKFCQDIHREGDEKNECAGEITDTPITKGAPVYLWMAYAVRLLPRFLYDPQERVQARVLNTADMTCCIECGTPFMPRALLEASLVRV